jgi:hypothetical protein
VEIFLGDHYRADAGFAALFDNIGFISSNIAWQPTEIKDRLE